MTAQDREAWSEVRATLADHGGILGELKTRTTLIERELKGYNGDGGGLLQAGAAREKRIAAIEETLPALMTRNDCRAIHDGTSRERKRDLRWWIDTGVKLAPWAALAVTWIKGATS